MYTPFSFETESVQKDKHAQSTIEVADETVDWSRCRSKDLSSMHAICSIPLILRDEDKDICGTHEGGHAQ